MSPPCGRRRQRTVRGDHQLVHNKRGLNSESAVYTLAIIKTPGGQVAWPTIVAIGNATGAAANDPSFTLDVFLNTESAYYLHATEVGSTSEAFKYTGWAAGRSSSPRWGDGRRPVCVCPTL